MPENNPKIIDPTFNVIELVETSIKRIDDVHNLDIARLDEKISERDAKYQVQFNAAKEAVGIAQVALEKQTAQALDGTKEAINKADITTDKRFSLLSEKIDGVMETISKNTGERGIYVTHTDLSIAMDKLQAGIEASLRPVITFMNNQTGKSTGVEMTWGRIAMIVGIISAVVALIFRFNV